MTGLAGRELASFTTPQTGAQIADFNRQFVDTDYHPVGNCQMGSGANDAVIASLRVHGLQRLRVMNTSTMPPIVAGNPDAPTITIAERATDLTKAAASSA